MAGDKAPTKVDQANETKDHASAATFASTSMSLEGNSTARPPEKPAAPVGVPLLTIASVAAAREAAFAVKATTSAPLSPAETADRVTIELTKPATDALINSGIPITEANRKAAVIEKLSLKSEGEPKPATDALINSGIPITAAARDMKAGGLDAIALADPSRAIRDFRSHGAVRNILDRAPLAHLLDQFQKGMNDQERARFEEIMGKSRAGFVNGPANDTAKTGLSGAEVAGRIAGGAAIVALISAAIIYARSSKSAAEMNTPQEKVPFFLPN